MTSDQRDPILTKQYDPESDEPLSIFVVRFVGAVSDTHVTDLEPLGRYIDTDQLNELFSPGFLPLADVSATVTFPYAGYRVEVRTDGRVMVYEGSPADEDS